MQAHDDDVIKKKTQNSRTIDAIYLRPVMNQQEGGHELLNLQTKRVFTRPRVTTTPLTPAAIAAVEAMAATDGMSGLKIRTKTGNILWDSAWIAGVDYDEDEDDEDYDEYDDDEDGSQYSEEEELEEIDPNELAELTEEIDEQEVNPIEPQNEDNGQESGDEENGDEVPELLEREDSDSDSDEESDDEETSLCTKAETKCYMSMC